MFLVKQQKHRKSRNLVQQIFVYNQPSSHASPPWRRSILPDIGLTLDTHREHLEAAAIDKTHENRQGSSLFEFNKRVKRKKKVNPHIIFYGYRHWYSVTTDGTSAVRRKQSNEQTKNTAAIKAAANLSGKDHLLVAIIFQLYLYCVNGAEQGILKSITHL